jgi:hypothetical protein
VSDRGISASACGALVRSADARQGLNQAGAEFVKFPLMIFGKNAKHPLALRGHLQLDAPAIVQILIAMDESRFFTALAQFDNGVVSKPQPLRCLHFIRSSCDLQQQLVLLRVETCLGGATFAKLEELTELIPELRQIL